MTISKNKDFELETTLEYKNQDGSRGWIIIIKPKKDESK